MTRIAAAALATVVLAGCFVSTGDGPPPPECRCQFALDGVSYDIPCGTTVCAGTVPAVCSPEGEGAQLDGSCDADARDSFTYGVCELDVREEHCGVGAHDDCPVPPAVSECTHHRSGEGCLEHGGCVWRPADCAQAPEGCHAYKSE